MGIGEEHPMKSITLEEHFVTADYLNATGAAGVTPELQPKLLDLGAGRIESMDANDIAIQVLSLATGGIDALPAGEATAVIRGTNDELAAAIRANPDRLAGFASIVAKDPESAAKELERCVNELGFVGLMLDGTCDGAFLDQPEFLPIFEAANALKVPVYLHPAPPPAAVKEAYYSGLPDPAGFLLSIAGWGWHAECGLHVLRLIVSGLFERFPDLQLIIGHMGEGLPYALDRSSGVLSATRQGMRSVKETFLGNVHVTTSGYFTKPPFQCAVDMLGIDRLLYSVDYPFSPNEKGSAFLNGLGLADTELEAFTLRNAERLLGLKID